ncbi:MAG: SLC13/DASS family transporter [Armatimonadetes bacterium]|nr:SLC13/DASS family transporter [Armatimonadota bacterium]
MPKPTRTFWLLLGPLAMLAVLACCDLQHGKPEVTRMAAMTLWMAIWWVAEPVPLAVTALLPIATFPFLGILSSKDLGPVYMDQVSFLFIGGFLVALAMERWGLNQRVALQTAAAFGGTPARLLLGFLLATGGQSMWMSNTAAALVMMPPVMAVILRLEARDGADAVRPLAVALLLAVAYGASIGGVGTLVGTPTNLVFVRQMHIAFPKAPAISFLGWMKIGVPLVAIMLLAAWGVLWFLYLRRVKVQPLTRAELGEEIKGLGAPTFEQKVIVVLAVLMVAMWVFREDVDLGGFTLLGWTHRLKSAKLVGDSTVAMIGALLLFLIPSRSERGRCLLTWEDAQRLPWDIVMLFGGGFALAKGFQSSGLDKWCGHQLSSLGTYSPLTIALAVCLALVFITEFTANTSTVEMVLPVLAAVAAAIRVNPLFLLVPATICASFGFMLPAGTPPNALVFSARRMSVVQMARTGFLLNVLGAVLATLAVLTWGRYALGGDLLAWPAWGQ